MKYSMIYNFKSTATHIFLLTLYLGFAGCSNLPRSDFDPMDMSTSVVFGYIDTEGMPSEFGWVKIQGLNGDENYVTATTAKGAFWHISVKPGYRKVAAFGGFTSDNIYGNDDDANSYNFVAKDRNGIAVEIKRPGVHFMGSYKFINKKNNKFGVSRIKTPGEKKVLQMVLDAMKEEGTNTLYPRQFNMIKKKILKLR